MARYAWKSTGADGTEATGTFAFTSVSTIELRAVVDVDGTLIADGHLGYSGGFGSDRILSPLPTALEAGNEAALEFRGAGAKLSIDDVANRVCITTLNNAPATMSVLLNPYGVEYLRAVLNKALEDVDPDEILASASEDASEQA
jgi:hypothetical protein